MIHDIHQRRIFFKLYFDRLKQFDTYGEAYESVERDYFLMFGRRKYKNYNSFQTSMRYHIKNG